MEIDILQAQVGLESTWGTNVTTTAKLMGVTNLSLKPAVETAIHQDRRASFQPGHLTNTRTVTATGTLDALLLYEDVAYWLDSLLGTATPSGGGPYVRDYAMPDSSAPSPKLQTLSYGETGAVETLISALAQKATFKFPRTGELTYSLDLLGYKVIDTASLAALSDRSVNVAMASDCSLYIDTWAGTIGTTEITSTAWSAEVVVDTKRDVKFKPGSMMPYGYRHRRFDASLKLRMEANATTLALQTAVLAQTAGATVQKQIRLKATRDLTTSLKLFQVDFAGTFLNASEIFPDDDGLGMVEFEIGATYNSTLANSLKIQSKNGVSALV